MDASNYLLNSNFEYEFKIDFNIISWQAFYVSV